MRRGFLVSSAAPAEEELVWLSTKAGGLRNHIARVIKRDTDNDKVVLALLADGKKRVVVSSDVHAVPKRSADARALTIDVKASESAITTLLGKWGFRTGEVTVFLQPELVNHILNCLRVPRVDMRHVRAMSCSSIAEHGGRCSITNALDPSTENWWISGDHAQGGVGAEWISFRLLAQGEEHASPSSGLDVCENVETTSPVPLPNPRCRVEQLTLRIPPLPGGPLSVRELHLECTNLPDGPWARCSPDFTTMDSCKEQTFHLEPPVEAAFMRIVCSKNAARGVLDAHRARMIRQGHIDPEAETDEDHQHAQAQVPANIGFYSCRFS